MSGDSEEDRTHLPVVRRLKLYIVEFVYNSSAPARSLTDAVLTMILMFERMQCWMVTKEPTNDQASLI